MAENIAQSAKTHGCARCQNRWGGANTSHCGSCHHTFTGLSAFDAHRAGDHADGSRHCIEPTDAGLGLNRNGYWSNPSDGTEWWAEIAARKAKRARGSDHTHQTGITRENGVPAAISTDSNREEH